jgi:hypothetical protein
MESLRNRWLRQMQEAIQRHEWQVCLEFCFRVLYGLPQDLQTSAATASLKRYLSTWKRHWPDSIWPQHLLANPRLWLEKHRRALPDEPNVQDPGDAAFISGLDGLLLALSFDSSNLSGVTSSCAFAVQMAIQAASDTAWLAADPQGVRAWQALSSASEEYQIDKELEKLVENLPENNPIVASAMENEWKAAVDWLAANRIWQHPDPVDEKTMEMDLLEWKNREMLLPPTPI